MESSLIGPLVVFVVVFVVMFCIYYCAQKRIKRIEDHVDSINKDIEGAAHCFLLRCNCRVCRNTNRNGTNRNTSTNTDTTTHETIWSISRQRNAIYGPPPNYQWPTHDQHISLDSFSLTGAHQQTIVPPATVPTVDTGGTKTTTPPPYSEVDLPSYEEAVTVEYQNRTHETISSTGRTQIY